MLNEGSLRGLLADYLEMVEVVPGAEPTFKILCHIETVLREVAAGKTRVREALEGKKSNVVRDLTEARIMQIVAGRRVSIDDLLGLMIDKLEGVELQHADIETVLQKLGIFFKKLPFVVVPPDHKERPEPERKDKSKEEPKYGNVKFLLLIDLLRENGVYTDDLIGKLGIIDSNMMRERTYLYIEIPRIKRYVLLCNEYGEATFVGKGTLMESRLKEAGKEELQAALGAIKINFFVNNNARFREELKAALFDETIDLSAKPNVRDIERYREACLNACPSPEQWMGMSRMVKKALKLFGKGLKAIGTILGCQSPDDQPLNPIGSSAHMAFIGRAVYGEGHDIIECELWDKGKWIEKIREACPSPEQWMEMNYPEKQAFKLFGKGLKAIESILGCTTPDDQPLNPIGSSAHMAFIGRAVYGEGHDIIECELWDKEKWIEKIKKSCPSPEQWMGMSRMVKKALKLFGKGLSSIGTILGCISPDGKRWDPVCSFRHMAVIGRVIYGEEHDIIECELWDKEKWIEKIKKSCPSPEQWMGMSHSEKKAFKLFGKGVTTIGSILGCTSPDDKKLNPIGSSKHMAIIGRVIYGEGHDIIEYALWDKEKWIKKIREACPSPEQWIGMSQTKRAAFQLSGKGLSAIGSILGCTSPDDQRWNPVGFSKHMAVMGRAVYGEGHDIIECELWDKEKWIEKIKKSCPSPEQWMGMSHSEKKAFKLFGKGLGTIRTILGCTSPDDQHRWNPVGSSNHMAIMGRVIYGEGHDIIEYALWDKEKWIEKIKKSCPSPEQWMGMSYSEKKAFKLFGKGLGAIGIILGCQSPDDKKLNPIGSSKHMAVIGRVIYGEGHDCIETLPSN